MPIRSAEAEWIGTLLEGKGHMKMGASYDGPFTFKSRMENGEGTNPEELLAMAQSGCFSMALSAALTKAGFAPKRIHTSAGVHFDRGPEGFSITSIDLHTEAEVPGIDDAKFQEIAEATKKGCPVSRALAATKINLQAKLVPAA